MTVKLTDRFLTSRKSPLAGRAIYTDANSARPYLQGQRQNGAQLRRAPRFGRCADRPRGQQQRGDRLDSGPHPACVFRQTQGTGQGRLLRPPDVASIWSRPKNTRRRHGPQRKPGRGPYPKLRAAYLDSVKLRLRSFRSVESRTALPHHPELGHKPVGDVTRSDVVEFLDGLEREGRLAASSKPMPGNTAGRSLLMPSNAS